jgi:Zn-dependent peptidase ImmA (M78 family)
VTPERLNEIAELAEAIAEENFSFGKVDLDGIIKEKDISLIYEEYEDYFLGELVHASGKFYIYLNSFLLPRDSPKIRFTIGHELGHYFIDDHRNKLKMGISLSHSPKLGFSTQILTEREADHFSSNLLMPKTRFISATGGLNQGMEAILHLRKQFETSIQSTAHHYINIDILPCMFIKWNADLTYHYASYSNKLSELTGIKGRPVIKYNSLHVKSLFDTIEASDLPFLDDATRLSKWVATIAPGSEKDLIGLEQTICLGAYGGITFLSFH